MWQGSKYTSECSYGRVLNIPGFWLCQVSAYASITEGSEYVWIWLNKLSCGYAWILNGSDAVHSVRSLYKLLSSYQHRHIQNMFKHLRWIVFAKRIMPECRCIVRIFQDREGIMELGLFNKHFVKNARKKKTPQGNILEFFLLDTPETTFWIANLNIAFFSK